MHSALTTGPVDVDALMRRVGASGDGAVLLFLGTVRDHNDGRPVSGMEYHAYDDMARRVLGEIAADVAERLGTDRVAIEHRTGALGIGDVSVAVAVSSPHRAEAFDACRLAIEEIKRRLPVWKREHYTDADERWLDGERPPVPERAEAP